jgi:hypothetical protein
LVYRALFLVKSIVVAEVKFIYAVVILNAAVVAMAAHQ